MRSPSNRSQVDGNQHPSCINQYTQHPRQPPPTCGVLWQLAAAVKVEGNQHPQLCNTRHLKHTTHASTHLWRVWELAAEGKAVGNQHPQSYESIPQAPKVAPAHLWRVRELAAEVVAAAGPVLAVAVVPLRPAAPPARLGVLWVWRGHAQQVREVWSCTVCNSPAAIVWPAYSPLMDGHPPAHATSHTPTPQLSNPQHNHRHTPTPRLINHTHPRARVVGAARGVGVLVAIVPAAVGGGVDDARVVAGPDAGGKLLTHVAAAAAVGVASGAVLVLACAAAAAGRQRVAGDLPALQLQPAALRMACNNVLHATPCPVTINAHQGAGCTWPPCSAQGAALSSKHPTTALGREGIPKSTTAAPRAPHQFSPLGQGLGVAWSSGLHGFSPLLLPMQYVPAGQALI